MLSAYESKQSKREQELTSHLTQNWSVKNIQATDSASTDHQTHNNKENVHKNKNTNLRQTKWL